MSILLNNLGKFVLVYAVTFIVWLLPTVISTYTGIGPFGVIKGDQIAYGFAFVIANIVSAMTAVALTCVNWRLKGVSVIQISLYSVISVLATMISTRVIGDIGLAGYTLVVLFGTPWIVALMAYLILKKQRGYETTPYTS